MLNSEQKLRQKLNYLFSISDRSTINDWGPFWDIFRKGMAERGISESFLREIFEPLGTRIILRQYYYNFLSKDFIREFGL